MIKIYHNSTKDKKLKSIKNIHPGSWVFVESPNNEDIANLSRDLSLHKDFLEDALDPHEVPRVEVEDGVIYIFLRAPKKEDDHIVTKPLLIIISEKFLLTIIKENLPIIEKFQDNQEFLTTQKTKFFLQILASISHSYSTYLASIRKNIRQATVGFDRVSNKNIITLVQTEEILDDFLSSLVAMDAMIEKIISGKLLKLYEDDSDLIDDIALDNQQLISLCRSSIKSISSIRGAYSTIMTNNLNNVIKLLTALTIILTVPTIIFSFWGMNVALPLEDSGNAYMIILSITGAIVASILMIFAYKKWL